MMQQVSAQCLVNEFQELEALYFYKAKSLGNARQRLAAAQNNKELHDAYQVKRAEYAQTKKRLEDCYRTLKSRIESDHDFSREVSKLMPGGIPWYFSLS